MVKKLITNQQILVENLGYNSDDLNYEKVTDNIHEFDIDYGVEDSDYVMYVFAMNENSNTLAYASACGYLGPNKRPIMGSFEEL